MPLISVKTYHLLLGAACGLALKFAVYYKGKNAKKMRHGREYGSAEQEYLWMLEKHHGSKVIILIDEYDTLT